MMKKMITVLITVAFMCSTILFMTSCAKKQVGAQSQDQPPVFKPEIVQPREQGPQGPAVTVTEPKDVAPVRATALENAIKIITSGNIYFAFDKSELTAESKAVLQKKAEYLRAYPELSIIIEGHCDERGTNEYNLALGERRADAAFKYLNAMGIAGDRMKTVSYGEERPADPGHNESAWAKNRRDEFKVIK